MRCTKGDIYTSFSSTHQCWLRRRHQNDLKRIHRPLWLASANKTSIRNLSLKILPNKKNINSQKSSPQKISHSEFGLQKLCWLSFFGASHSQPFSRGTFTCERPLFNSQPQEVQVSPLKQFVAGRRLAHHLVHVPFDKAVPFRRQEWNCQWMDHEDTSKHFLENKSATGKHHTLLSD